MIAAEIDPALVPEAIDAARRALRRMDDKDIPPRLRAIAARSGRLPAPLARRLIVELDASDWLRAEAMAEIDPGLDDAASGMSASLLFLRRPEEWTERIDSLATGQRESAEQSQVKRLESELRRVIAKSDRLEERLSAAERREQEAAQSVDKRLAAAMASQQRSQGKLKAARDRLAEQLAAAEQEVSRLGVENSSLRQKIEEARSVRGKSSTSTAPRKVAPAWSLKRPTDIARHLDDINRRLLVTPAQPEKSEALQGLLRLSGPPAGVRPDRPEAIEWLIGLPGLVNVAIDGWNAAHLLKSPPVAATRNRVVEAARRLILASSGKRRITAVFDSSQPGESFSADDVKVTFVPSADEELIAMANRDPTRLVVITSDRRVREAVESAGAVGLWSEALIDWLKTAGRRTFRA
jgi:hypothetical protein